MKLIISLTASPIVDANIYASLYGEDESGENT